MHSSRMRTVRSSSRLAGLGRGCLAGGGLPGGICPSTCWDTHPPCEQNDRQVSKHDLAGTTLRTVLTIESVTTNTTSSRFPGKGSYTNCMGQRTGKGRGARNIMHVCLHVLNNAPLLARAFVLLFYAIDKMT